MSEVRKPRCYIASPFFNPSQIAGVRELEKALESCGYEVYSPCRDGKICPPNGSIAERQDAFKENCCQIEAADLVVAWLDWLLQPGLQVRVIGDLADTLPVEFPPQIQQLVQAGAQAMGISFGASKKSILLPGEAAQGEAPKGLNVVLQQPAALTTIHSPALNVPDSGTVWEVGYAYAQDVPVFSVSLIGQKLNIMLTESVVCHAVSMDELKSNLSKYLPVALEPCSAEWIDITSELKVTGAHKGEVQ
jgi:nucleoside 2-deoxyribosyltransferase